MSANHINEDIKLMMADAFAKAKKYHNGLSDNLERLTKARIRHGQNCDTSRSLIREAVRAYGTGNINEAHDKIRLGLYAVSETAKQARANICKRPRHAELIKAIEEDSDKFNNVKAETYRALLPFAMRDFENVPEIGLSPRELLMDNDHDLDDEKNVDFQIKEGTISRADLE